MLYSCTLMAVNWFDIQVLHRLTSSSCKGLWPLAKDFFGPKKGVDRCLFLFKAIFGVQ